MSTLRSEERSISFNGRRFAVVASTPDGTYLKLRAEDGRLLYWISAELCS